MNSKTVLICYYNKSNRYSFNALVGAIETVPELEDLKIHFFWTEEELVDGIENLKNKYKNILVCFSFCSSQNIFIKNVIHNIKNKFSKNNLIFIAGGPHATGCSLETLDLGFDIAVIGEGEETFIELLKRIAQNESLSDITRIVYRSENDKKR